MKTQDKKWGYQAPKVKRVRLDSHISIQMTSPPPDPPGAPKPPGVPTLPISTGDNGEINPF